MALAKPSDFKPDTAYMEVPRCDRCQHWTDEKTLGDFSTLEDRFFVVGQCALFSTKPGEVVPVPDPLPLAVARGAFITKPSFGCVQFEERIKTAFQGVMFYSSAPKVCSLCKAKVPAWTLHQCSTGTPRRTKKRNR